jgi:carbon-monoxide dehydrogenase large subunit
VLERAGYAGLRAEQDRRRRAGDPRLLGIGLAVYVEVTSSFPGADHAAVSFTAGGRVAVLASSGPSGQGHETAWARVAADVLGVPAERVDVALGDTDRVPAGTGTIGSRSMQTIGVAVHDAAGRVRDEARRLAADLLEAHPGDVAFDPAAGRFHVVGAPWRGCSWDDLLAAEPDRAALSAVVEHVSGQPTFPFGAHLSVVEVDAETGFVTVLRHIAVDDAGTVIHPTLFAGQVHGGIAQGIGQALYEHFEYDESGNPQSGSFLTYCFPDAEQVPRPELITMETPTPHNPLGAKGVGESGTIGATPAVQNAVIDAVSHLGVRHIDMPLTPERVWRAIAAARG